MLRRPSVVVVHNAQTTSSPKPLEPPCVGGKEVCSPLSPIGRIKILTYLIWGFLGAAIFDCIIRSCDLFYWFIRTCLGPTVGPAAITSLELFCVLTMCYFSDNVSSKENIKILWLIFMFYYSDIIARKNSYWFFSFT